MKSTNKRIVFEGFVFCIFLVGVYSCTKADLEVKNNIETPQVDDQLEIRGQVCAEPPDNANFPVKVMFIVDCSGSLQQTDEMDHRVEAIRQVVQRYANNSQVYFNIIKFNGRVAKLTTGLNQNTNCPKTNFVGLTGNETNIFGPAGLLEADSMTDYEGGLGVAYQELMNDMMCGSLAELSRTKYVVIFFSDGTPDPVCYGCSTDPNSPRYAATCSPDLHVFCMSANTFLNMDEVAAEHNGSDTQLFPLLADGTDYNNDYQIFNLVDAIMDLGKAYHVGELRLHTAFLYCRDQFGNPTSALCAAAEIAYNLDPERGRALLKGMAERGNGTFRDFTSGQDINFLKIDYTAIKSNYIGKNLLVTNLQAFPSGSKYVADSDGDGLPDDQEYTEGTNPLLGDSDGDGYSDLIEIRFRNAGFDPLDPNLPTGGLACPNPLDDSDYDGLSDCEEVLLGTKYNDVNTDVDTDGDGFPDMVEVMMGTDPTRDDSAEDLDADGHRNADELLFHTNPAQADNDLWNKHRYWYEMQPVASDNNQQCYEFDIRYITLVTTLQRTGASAPGYNDILLYFDQASNDNPQEPGRFRVACVRAQYVAPDYKIPVSGQVTLKDTDFVKMSQLNMDFSDASTCVTASNQ